jgi:excisionase family DNA binding protein
MSYPLLTQTEVCRILRVSKKTLQNWRVARKIGYVKFGHCCIRFRQEDVQEFIRRRERKEVQSAYEVFNPQTAVNQ